MIDRNAKPLRLGFEDDCIAVPLSSLHPSKILPPNIRQTVKYEQIRDSLKAIGLVEPLAVLPHSGKQGDYTVLDGNVRLEAFREIGVEHALCLVSKDDEAYTYNRRVNRLSAVQEHRMIVRAADRGVSASRLSNALGISESTIRERFKLLDGVCEEAVRLLADKPAPRGVFRTLRQMKPFRQIDVVQSMIDLNNYSVKLSLAMLQTTPADQLTDESKAKSQKGGPSEAIQRLQRELAALQADTKLLDESYGPTNLQLVIVKTYVRGLLDNARVVRWLARLHKEYLQQLQLLVDVKELPSD